MKVYCVTDIGYARKVNEDSYYMPVSGEAYFAVADGMGGHSAGEVASALAVETFAKALSEAEFPPSSDALKDVFMRANLAIYGEAKRNPEHAGMGTTMTAIWYGGAKTLIGHVGDSRAYLMRDGALTQMTSDHSYVQELVRTGVITPEMALIHPQRNIIMRALGSHGYVETDVIEADRRAGDVWLLCTDGLTRYINDDEILDVLTAQLEWNEKLAALVNAALERGGLDNITALIAVEEDAHE